ncbi:MAG: prolyl oligopeptidase family serine peptidase [Deltaproteobacteria bacterium]|nr:prolyl oligopeptidase family serine peptidase [Deltaproteobacteria bacterium]
MKTPLSPLRASLLAALVASIPIVACGGSSGDQASSGSSSGSSGSPTTDPPPGTPPPTDGGPTSDGAPEPLPSDPLAACPAAYKSSPPKSGLNTGFEVAGQQRELVVILPPASFTGPRPLFVGFNGTSENGTRFATRAKLADFAAKGFLVVVPSSVGNGSFWPIWDAMRKPGQESAPPNADLALFDAIVGCMAGHFTVDKNRIFVGGHSAGGIFTNKVLRARSKVVAGGIVGSGVFSLTQSGDAAPLDPMFVMVTWGGDNDSYRGTTPNGVNVPEFSFVEQASLASKYYEAQTNVQQVQCRGDNLGHAWLPINAWFADMMIAHPKGAAKTPIVAPPASAPVSCSESAYEVPPLPAVTCGTSTTAGCQAACQLTADCIAENRTVGVVMKNQLTSFGFSGTSCGGCLTKCAQAGASAANTAVLSCFQSAQATAQCGAGIEGAFPHMAAVEKCCKGRSDSTFCVGLCTSIVQNEAASAFYPSCAAIAQ